MGAGCAGASTRPASSSSVAGCCRPVPASAASCSSLAARSAGLRTDANAAIFHSEATVRKKRQSLADAARFVLQLEIGGRPPPVRACRRRRRRRCCRCRRRRRRPRRTDRRRRRPRRLRSSSARPALVAAVAGRRSSSSKPRHLPKVLGVGLEISKNSADQRRAVVLARTPACSGGRPLRQTSPASARPGRGTNTRPCFSGIVPAWLSHCISSAIAATRSCFSNSASTTRA